MLDPIIEVAKHAPMSMSKSEWYQEIFKRTAAVANLVAHGAMSGDDLDLALNKRASERRQPGESSFQSFNKCYATSNPRDP